MIIFLLLAVSLILRLINLNQSLWLDEAVQAITAKESLSYIFQEIRSDFHPPLYHFLIHFWVSIFGNSEIAVRMPSVLFGIGTVFLIYKISGKLGAVLLATAPFHIYYSQEARGYSMACFSAVLSMYFFLTLDKSKNNKYLYFFSTVLMLYADYYGFLVLLAQGIYLITKKNYKFLLICLFAYLLIYLPWVSMLITQLKTGMLATQTLPGWGRLVNVSFWKAVPLTFIKFTIGRITIFNKTIYALLSSLIISLCGFLIVKGFFKGKNLLIILWFFVPLAVSWLASLFVPNFQPFRLLLTLPAFYLLLTAGISAINSYKVRTLMTGLFLTINLVCLSIYFFNPYFQREDWKGAVSFLTKQKALVLLPSGASSWPIKYYDPKSTINLLFGTKEASQISETFKIGGNKKDELYYIRYLVPVFDPQEKILLSLEKEGYTKTDEISFNQIFILKYQKR